MKTVPGGVLGLHHHLFCHGQVGLQRHEGTEGPGEVCPPETFPACSAWVDGWNSKKRNPSAPLSGEPEILLSSQWSKKPSGSCHRQMAGLAYVWTVLSHWVSSFQSCDVKENALGFQGQASHPPLSVKSGRFQISSFDFSVTLSTHPLRRTRHQNERDL